MRTKGQLIGCANNESQMIVRNSYQIYQIVKALIQYEKQDKNVNIQYVNLTKKYKNILTRLQRNSRGKIKEILSHLFEPLETNRKIKSKRRAKKIKKKQNKKEENIEDNDYFAFDIGSKSRNGRYVEQAYTSTVVETDKNVS